ncbi:16S rRNA processing protein RimM [bacterium]|nr:16S rRNA processing protein RimM [bacterium]
MTKVPGTLVTIGTIFSAHGLKGEVKIRLFHHDQHRLESLRTLFLVSADEEQPHPVTIQSIRYLKQIPIVRFFEISTRTEAEYLRGSALMVLEKDMITLADDEYFCHDLLGATVYDRTNKEYGVVTEILETGSNDVLAVVGKEGEVLVPFLKSVIVQLDKDRHRLIIDPLPGLFEGDED